MEKDNLFNLIRNEEVIIWAGAGISINAGYPAGKKLSEILYNDLSESEKQVIGKNLNLPDLTEEIYRVKGGNKNYIIKTLKSVFDKSTDLSETHDIISKIPHFKSIITTNYDRLFETSYKNNGCLVLNESNIPYINKDQTPIFKVHGDLSNPNSIIITKSDYNNFFKENSENNTYWTVVKERLSTNAILFLGYNLEDSNVSVIFDKISESLSENRKECFLVSPNLPSHKVKDLLRKGITYIDSTAEEILNDLIKVLKENIVEDLENKKVSADTFKKFLLNFNLLPSLDATENSYNVTSIKGAYGNQVEGKINFTIKNEKEIIEKLHDFTHGKEFGEIELDENILQNVDLFFGDIRLARKEKLVKLKFQSTPKYDTKVNLRFDNGYEFEDFPVKVYGNKDLIEIHSNLKNADLIFKINIENFPKTNFKFNFKHKEFYSTTKSELEFFNFLKNFSSGESFTIFINENQSITQKFEKFSDLYDDMQFLIGYFEKLQVIEKHFKIQFRNFDVNEVNEDNYDLICRIAEIIERGYIVLKFEDEINFELIENYSEETKNLIKEIGKNDFPIIANHKIEDIKEIHGQTINLGFAQLEYLSPYVLNMEEIDNRQTLTVKVRTKNNECRLSYNKIDM